MILGRFRLRESHPQSLLSLISVAYLNQPVYKQIVFGKTPLSCFIVLRNWKINWLSYNHNSLRQGRKTTKEKEPNKNGEQARPPIVTETPSTSELQARAGEGVKVALLRLSLPETVKIPLPLPVVPTEHRSLPKVSFSTHLFVFKLTRFN